MRYTTHTIRRKVYVWKQEDIPNGGFTRKSVYSHDEDCVIELEMDIDALAQTLGERAARSSRHRATMGSGMIKAKCTSTTPVPKKEQNR